MGWSEESLTHRHLVTVQGLLLGEGVKTLRERHVASPGGNTQTEVPERLEGDGLVSTVSTAESGLELSNKQINKVRVISPYVTLPGLHGLLTHASISFFDNEI